MISLLIKLMFRMNYLIINKIFKYEFSFKRKIIFMTILIIGFNLM